MAEAENYIEDFVEKVLGIRPEPGKHSLEECHYMIAVSIHAVDQAIKKEGMRILNATQDKKKIIT